MAGGGVADAAVVLLPEGVADPMKPVFDAPVVAPNGKQPLGGGLFRREAGDGVLDFLDRLAVAPRCPFQTQDLLEARPLREQRHAPRAGREMTGNHPPVFFAVGRRLAGESVFLTLSSGGKRPAGSRRQSSLWCCDCCL